jgi:hypothetical protein
MMLLMPAVPAPPTRRTPSRTAVLMAGAAIGLLVAGALMGSGWLLAAPTMVTELLVQAMYWLLCFGVGRVLLRRLGLAGGDALGIVSSAAAGFALIGYIVLGIGLIGALSPAVAWGLVAALGGVALWDLVRHPPIDSARLAAFRAAPSEGSWRWLLVPAAFAVAAVAACLMPGMLWRPHDPHPYDSLIYHLQVPREWFDLGRIQPLHHNVYSFFPFNVEIHYLLANYLRGDPWRAVYQNQFLSLSLMTLAGAAVWAGAMQQAGRRAAATSAMAFAVLPWIVMLGSVTYVEAGLLLYSALAIVWFARAMEGGESDYRLLALAGAFAGLACGVKLTALPVIVGALFVAPFFMAALRKALLAALILLAFAALTLSPWLIRNAAWSGGNPVFPLAMRALGQGHFTDVQVERFVRAHQPAPAHAAMTVRMYRAAGELLVNWQYGYVLFPAALVAGVMARRHQNARLYLLLILFTLAFWQSSTHLMGRFFVVATIPAALLLSLMPTGLLRMVSPLLALAALWCHVGLNPSLPGHDAGRNLLARLLPWTDKGSLGLFGFSDYRALNDERVQSLLDSGRTVLFVGDAQAFLRPAPSPRIRYCTVFDLQFEGRGWVDASYGPAPAVCPPDAAVVVDAAEARRLSASYHEVPPLELPPAGRYARLVLVGPPVPEPGNPR